ncbi:MAG: hypothetical protein ACLFST_05200, partial [Spirochaetia bacterium]
MSEFKYEASLYVPFRDKDVLDRIRNIKREDIDKHPNPEFKINVVPDDEVVLRTTVETFKRIKEAMEAGRRYVMIMPNPNPGYKKLAHMLNTFNVDCSTLYTFNMDEYADQDGNVAPETWKNSFMYSFKKYFYNELREDLRPKEEQIQGPTTENIDFYGK